MFSAFVIHRFNESTLLPIKTGVLFLNSSLCSQSVTLKICNAPFWKCHSFHLSYLAAQQSNIQSRCPNSRTMRSVRSQAAPLCHDLFIPFYAVLRGYVQVEGVAVGAKCYFCCKPHCNNNTRNPMKVELAALPRPPASAG